ncbi:MAG: hypothetical protein ACTHXO_03890 [Actinomycetaceae bacterium]
MSLPRPDDAPVVTTSDIPVPTGTSSASGGSPSAPSSEAPTTGSAPTVPSAPTVSSASTTPEPHPDPRAGRGSGVPRSTAVLTGISGLVLGAGGTLAVVALAGSGSAEAADPPSSVVDTIVPSPAEQSLSTAATECAVSATDGLELVDEGRTITFDNRGGEDFAGAAYSDIACVFDALALPATIDTHIGQTTSLDGRQTAHWEDFEIQWSYHPDRGLDGLVTVVDG